ncbi:heme-binding protein [Flavobacterium sp. 5]|uniref:heme-binding protein n=1 Tax=Flavobacterium sp. 5 TaxID=2035199 RepID=UPI000C2CD507|nr:heme-binding protein [Flavobacterium sp. 5]PKB18295.1 hypothetical protein CLU82_3565 [Flavobacterium sp. 5]
MALEQNNPLANLNLSGLNKLEAKTTNKTAKLSLKSAVLESAPISQPVDLGVLESLIGTWVGPGFNLIEVPNMNQAKPGPPPVDKFKIILNSTAETFTFSSIGGDIINRGNAQSDITFMGLHYLQQVDDVNLPSGQNGIHLETGLFLNLPSGTDPVVQPSIARLGSIPHGDSILAQGTFFTVDGPPVFEVADPTPFFIVNGKRVNDTSDTYLSQLRNAIAPPGIPQDVIMNPNILLENAIKEQNIIKTVVIFLDANPVDGVATPGATGPVGGITNIPFVNVNANANSLSAIFWIETVQNADGTTFLQLQYTQTVILDFPVFAPDGSVVEIKWPHISVATLLLQ